MFHGLSGFVSYQFKEVDLLLQYLRLCVDHTHHTDLRERGRERWRERGRERGREGGGRGEERGIVMSH